MTAPLTGSLDDQLTTRLMHQRILVLGEPVDDPIANRLCAELLLLSAEDPHRDISLYINSPGGSVSAGLAIYDTMRLIPNDVSTLAMGLAASMGQFLLSAGTPGKRYALPHSRVLMHQGSAGIGGTAIDIEIQAQNLEHTKNVMLRLISEHTGQSLETIERDSLRDRWFTAEEAREYGFVDQVITDVGAVSPARPSATFGVRAMSSYTIPSVVEKTHRGERAVDIYSRLLTDRIVYVGTEIDDGVANVVIAQLLHLESESPDTPINLYLNSPGGSVTAMLAIYDTMQFIRLRGRDDVRRAGGFVGGRAAGQRRTRPAHRAAARPRRTPPAVRRGTGHAARPRRPGQGDRADARRDGGDPVGAHRAERGAAA